MNDTLNRRQFAIRSALVGAGALAFVPSAPTILKAASSGQWGDLVGRFTYQGRPPERKKLKVNKDVPCCGKFDIRDESLMVGEDHGLQNVYLYVRSRSVQICPELAEAVKPRTILDNRGCIFIPHCMKIWYGKQEFHTINSDPVAQNIAFDPLGDTPCNVVLPVGGKASYSFNRKQNLPVPIKCNYHPWESGYILPRDNPYVEISAKDGTFRISKLPLGPLEFQAWQERIGYLSTEAWPKGRFQVEIKPGVNDLGTIEFSASMFAEK
jgi:hypothetical protein